jgi:hypothetical protein
VGLQGILEGKEGEGDGHLEPREGRAALPYVLRQILHALPSPSAIRPHESKRKYILMERGREIDREVQERGQKRIRKRYTFPDVELTAATWWTLKCFTLSRIVRS